MNVPRPFLRFLVASLVTTLVAAAGSTQSDRQSPDNYREKIDDAPAAQAARDDLTARSEAFSISIGGYTSIQVNIDSQGRNIVGDAANEPSIAVDPTDPLNIAIGWRQFDSVASNFRQAGRAYSLDGGLSWTFPGVLDPGLFRSDPVLDVDSNGTFYYNSLQSDFSADVFQSNTDGITWNAPVSSFGGDKNWMVVDRSDSNGNGNVYVNWQLTGGCCGNDTLTRSVDGAQSFETPVDIPEIPSLGSMAVGPNGELYVTGIQALGDDFLFARSLDARDAGEVPSFTTLGVGLGGEFGGTGFFGDGPNPGGLLGQVWIDTDSEGRIFILGSVDPPGDDPQDVHLIRSEDGGESWSEPKRVNDDGEHEDAWQWFGTLSAAPNGRLDVIWADTRESLNVRLSRIYYSYSWDGGDSWSPNLAVSPEFDSQIGWPNQDKIGDYYEMVSDATGSDLAYAATFNGEQDVFYLRLFPDCNVNGVSDVTDVEDGSSIDLNNDLQPDECQLVLQTIEPGEAGELNTFRVEAGTPGETVRYTFSLTSGHTGLPLCDGVELALGNPILIGAATVDENGVAELTEQIPAFAVGQRVGFQAVELDTCTVSNGLVHTFPR